MKKIVLAGGGTGGHLFPLATVVEYIKNNHKDEKIKFVYLGPKGGLEKKIMNNIGVKQRKILSGKLRRYFSLAYIFDLIKMPLGFLQSLFYLLIDMPDVIFAKGGYASVPVVLAGWFYRIPILIHESDAKPGMANEFLGNLATKVAISFERAKIHFPPSKVFLSGNPVSDRVLGGSAQQARKILGMSKTVKPVVLVLGGSQGAELINRRILQALKPLIDEYQVIHQTGDRNYQGVAEEAERQGFKIGHSDYYPIPFIGDEIKHFYALADVVISRAGATTIAEISANNKLSILVPISGSANDHQRMNAFEIARTGGAIVLEEDNFKNSMILLRIKQLVYDEKIKNKIEQGVGAFYNPHAAEIIVAEIFQLMDS